MIILALFLHVFPKDISNSLTDNNDKRIHSKMNSLFDSLNSVYQSMITIPICKEGGERLESYLGEAIENKKSASYDRDHSRGLSMFSICSGHGAAFLGGLFPGMVDSSGNGWTVSEI
jgi:hypothetical protein